MTSIAWPVAVSLLLGCFFFGWAVGYFFRFFEKAGESAH
jgi:hypothetical protein